MATGSGKISELAKISQITRNTRIEGVDSSPDTMGLDNFYIDGLQLEQFMAQEDSLVDQSIGKAAGIHDFEPGRYFRKGAAIRQGGNIWRAKNNFTTGAYFVENDWDKIPAGEWGSLSGNLEDQTDLVGALDEKLDKEIDYQNGVKSRFSHESDGGGYFLNDDNDNSVTFLGGNADTASNIKAEVYTKNRTTNIGTRIIQTLAKIFYTKNKPDAAVTNGDEIAVQSDVADSLAQAKNYTDGKINQLPKGAYYQGKLDYYGVNEAALSEFTPTEGQKALVADVSKIGTYTSGAWVLADIPGLQEGFYWLVVDMGEAEKHYQGRVIYNAQGGWDINEDRQGVPDGETLDYDDATGAVKVADIDETGITADDTDFGDTVSGGFHEVLLAVFKKIRGIFALLAGKVNIQQNASDEGKAMVIGSDRKLAPGVSSYLPRQVLADQVEGYGRDLRQLFKIPSTDPAVYIPQVMAEIRRRCNNNGEIDGSGIPDFRDIMIGDYIDGLDLSGVAAAPGGTAPRAWNNTYKNNQIVVAGFNTYKGVNHENMINPNHILFTFRNVICTGYMNPGDTNAGGYPATAMRAWLEGASGDGSGPFATKLKAALGGNYLILIKNIHSVKGMYAWNNYSVFLPSEIEVAGTQSMGDELDYYNTNVHFPIYARATSYRNKYFNGAKSSWWLSTPTKAYSTLFTFYHPLGHIDANPNYTSSTENGISPVFCAA